MSFPASPWELHGDVLLSVWRVGAGATATAFVDYRRPGTLAYRELLSARPVLDGIRPAVRIADIWVDSVTSRDGGRALWAIPKELADLRADGDAWTATVGDLRIAEARFRRRRRLPGRLPLRLRVRQLRDGRPVRAWVHGRATMHLATAEWAVPHDSPWSHLAGRRPLLSLVLSDFEIHIGG